MNKTKLYLGLSILTINILTACSHYKSNSEIMSTDSHYPTAEAASLSFIARDLKHHQVFTNNLNKCPAYTSPSQQTPLSNSYRDIISTCENNKFECYQSCVENDAVACYLVAVSLQEANYELPAEQVFQRSCELGIASGCTNRAAGILNFTEHLTTEQKKCIFSTFEKTCDWRDPWGCTMFADQLISEENAEPNYKKALNVLNYSCKYSDTDPACQSAKRLRKFINSKIKPD
ncbi:hypothetical protein [Acinetobacter junii]|uniref:hypothetical protein n=1 Tax=Acinetobacter junii TaxID=40215 RepID=UPI001FB50A04|nr:hypothetical protein [Acinetobacter junii]UOB53459.1 hypothetical protein MRY16_05735 [Acinetobacter junii]